MKTEKTVDRGSKEKLYVQVYSIFLEKIEKGEWPDGSQIPPEDELCRMYEVSKVTVREAIHELVREGYLRRQQGRGTFVTHTIPHAGLMMRVRLSEHDLFGEEVTVQKKIIERGVRKSSEETRKFLTTEEDVYYILRKITCNEELFAEEFSLPVFILPNIHSEPLSETSLYDLIEAKGTKKIFRIHQTTELSGVQEKVARHIRLDAGMPALVITRVFLGSDGMPFAYSRIMGGGRKHTLHMEFERLK